MKFLYTLVNIFFSIKVINALLIRRDNANLGVDCYNNIKTYIDKCFPSNDSLSLNNLDNTCKNYIEEECQNFVKSPFNVVKECEGNDILKKQIQDYVDDMSSVFKVICQKNEQGEYCPLSKLQMYKPISFEKITDTYFEYNIPNKENFIKAIEDSCESKKCYETYYEYMSINYINDDKERLTQIVKEENPNETQYEKITKYELNAFLILSEEKCKTQANSKSSSTNSQESSSFKINAYSGLVLESVFLILISQLI